VTEGRRRGEAGLARVNMAPVFRSQAAEIQQLDGDIGRGGEHVARNLQKPVRLRHFARTCMLAARRAIDQQNGRLAALGVPALRVGDGGASGKPIHRKLVVRIGKFRARLVRPRGLAAVRIGVPRRRGDLVKLAVERIECGILELSEKAPAELRLGQARAGHSLAGRKPRHRIGTNAAGPRRLRHAAAWHPRSSGTMVGRCEPSALCQVVLARRAPHTSVPACRPAVGGARSFLSPRIAK
jgi:hypothetical protein